MKKKLLFIFALLCMVAQGAWAQRVVDLSTLTGDYVAKDGDVLTGELGTIAKISIAAGATVTLRDAKIIGSDEFSFIDYKYLFAGITCEGDATITLEGDNEVCGNAQTYPGIQPGPAGTTLTIKGSGSLKARSNGMSTGIGCCYEGSCGNIVIEGGNITANGGDKNGAGIGSCDDGSCGDITIKGGYITADGGGGCAGIGKGYKDDSSCGIITITGGEIHATGNCAWDSRGEYDGSGAGIGGGYEGNGGEIYIYDGIVYAKGGSYAAGIGGGSTAYGGKIWIEGGTIYAYGGQYAAGIGGGWYGTGGDIFIIGGTVNAFGGDAGAGIGGGTYERGGAIWITGGTVKAYGGKGAAGIGGGSGGGDSGSIVINGGDVYAKGDGYGVGIGAGGNGDVNNTISINGGTVEAYGGDDINRAIGGVDAEDYSHISIGNGMSVTEVTDFGEQLLPSYYRGYFLSSYSRLRFEPCNHAGQELSYAYVDDEKHKFLCQWCGWNEEEHTDLLSCTKCNYVGTPQYAHYYEMVYNEQEHKYEYQEVATETFKKGLLLPELKSPLPTDRVFVGWVAGAPDANDDGLPKKNETLCSSGQYINSGAAEINFKARYISNTLDLAMVQSDQKVYDGMIVTGTLNTTSYPVKITIANNATVTLSNVNISGVNNASYSWAGITCEGNATIILADGTTNTVKGFYEEYPGIFVPQDYTLTIKGETAGTGSLGASSNGFGAGIGGGYYGASCGNITIKGGNITATGGKYCAGIGSSHNNSCGNIIISGGTINATGGEDAAGIGSGWGGNNQGDFSSCGAISISSNVNSVTATKGAGAPNSIGAGAGNNATCGKIVIDKNERGPISTSPYTYRPLLDISGDISGDMTGDLEAAMGKTFDITFRGRKFIINSEWNTLCLPFSMTAEQIGDSPLANGKIVELDTEKTTLSDGVLTIAYKTATAIEAGKPYMVKWVIGEDAEDTHIDDPIFKNVTISTAAPTAVSAAGITFSGAFAPLTLASGDKTRLWLDDDVRLRWASGQDEQVSPTWCYWNLGGLDASTLNAIVVTFDDGSRPIVELMDGMTDFSILSAFGEQEVNASLEGRELSAVQQEDGTWQSRAYTLCLPFYAELFGTGCDFTIYSKAEVTENNELLFTEEMLPFLYPGNAYLIVVNEGTLRLQEEGVTIIAEADEADDDENAVPFNYLDEQIAGYWLGSLKAIGHDEAVRRKAFTLASDGSFKIINHARSTWKWPAFRAMFCATDLMTADKLTTKYQLDANGKEEEDRSLPAPDSYQGDNDGEATGIAPVIHTIDLDGTERWFDLNGRQLSGKPTQKGVYIHRGKKQVVK